MVRCVTCRSPLDEAGAKVVAVEVCDGYCHGRLIERITAPRLWHDVRILVAAVAASIAFIPPIARWLGR